MSSDPIEIALEVTRVLEELGVEYAIVGPVASSAYGEMRATMDVDMVADLELAHVDRFASKLGQTFYHDAESIRDAIRRKAHFNVIHLEGMMKVDVFIPESGGFDREELRRRRLLIIGIDPERSAYLASPEDVLLHKLDWFKQGDGVSDRHWSDVIGILKVQAARLDLGYLRAWATRLDLVSLFERAIEEAGFAEDPG